MTLNFDPNSVEPDDDRDFDLIPAGKYHVTIVGSDLEQGKQEKTGEMLVLTVELDADEHPELAGRKLWSRLCINHQNQQPRKIAQRQLSKICHVLGIDYLDDEATLLGAPLMVRVKIEPPSNGYEARSSIAAWMGRDEGKTKEPPKRRTTEDSDESERPKAKSSAKRMPWKR